MSRRVSARDALDKLREGNARLPRTRAAREPSSLRRGARS
jgi:hypothetical protein